MSNSKLISLTKISPNRNSPRNHTIDRVTVHCYVGQASIESMAAWFATTSAACSCNYAIGADGRIALIVPEADRSWCSSSKENDHRAITIECASDAVDPYTVNSKVYNSLIALLADICKRNKIKELTWVNDKANPGNMTVHRWFAAKACPGDYLFSRMGKIADAVNVKLGVVVGADSETASGTASGTTSGTSGTSYPANLGSVRVGDTTIEEIARVVWGEAGVIAARPALLAVAQCISDMLDVGGYGGTITAVMRGNFAAYGGKVTTDAARKAAYDVFVRGERRYKNARILQFRSFTKYSDGHGNMDRGKCASLLAKYEYLGKDARDDQWGHLYFGKKLTKAAATYIVQAGSFSKKANATAQCKKIKAARFDAFVKADGNEYKIQAGAYTDKYYADQQVLRLKAAGFDAIVKSV